MQFNFAMFTFHCILYSTLTLSKSSSSSSVQMKGQPCCSHCSSVSVPIVDIFVLIVAKDVYEAVHEVKKANLPPTPTPGGAYCVDNSRRGVLDTRTNPDTCGRANSI